MWRVGRPTVEPTWQAFCVQQASLPELVGAARGPIYQMWKCAWLGGHFHFPRNQIKIADNASGIHTLQLLALTLLVGWFNPARRFPQCPSFFCLRWPKSWKAVSKSPCLLHDHHLRGYMGCGDRKNDSCCTLGCFLCVPGSSVVFTSYSQILTDQVNYQWLKLKASLFITSWTPFLTHVRIGKMSFQIQTNTENTVRNQSYDTQYFVSAVIE